MTEQQQYEVVRSLGRAELRRYAPHVVAEVDVDASFRDAGNRAFRTLAGYIGGKNRGSRSVAMTAPVTQAAAGGSPSGAGAGAKGAAAKAGSGSYVVGFVLPAGTTLENAAEPTDQAVRLRAVDEQLAAALRFSGRWTQESFDHHLGLLEREVRAAWLTPDGPPLFARFNPPITPWFLRRNEVVVPVVEVAEHP